MYLPSNINAYDLEETLLEYQKEALKLVSIHVGEKLIHSFVQMLCRFYPEDEAQKMMSVMGIRTIHIFALEDNLGEFYEEYVKEINDEENLPW
jgi:hypothetical protein